MLKKPITNALYHRKMNQHVLPVWNYNWRVFGHRLEICKTSQLHKAMPGESSITSAGFQRTISVNFIKMFCRRQKSCAYVLVFVLYSNISVMSQEIWGFILIPSDLQDPVSLITEESYEQCHNPYKIIISFPVTWPIQTQIRSFQASSRTGNFSRKERLDKFSRM